MPKAFEKCVKQGGKVRTKKLKGKKYIRLCKKKSGGWTKGYVKKKKGK